MLILLPKSFYYLLPVINKISFFNFISDEIAEVAMALLPFLLKSSAKDGLTQLQAFVHFLPVSDIKC